MTNPPKTWADMVLLTKKAIANWHSHDGIGDPEHQVLSNLTAFELFGSTIISLGELVKAAKLADVLSSFNTLKS